MKRYTLKHRMTGKFLSGIISGEFNADEVVFLWDSKESIHVYLANHLDIAEDSIIVEVDPCAI